MALALAFLRRDWMRRASYRLMVVWQLIGLVAAVLGLYFGTSAMARLMRSHGGDAYIAFLLAGIAFTDLFLTTMQAFTGSLREAQLQGNLEPMLLSPVRVPSLVAASSLFPVLQTSMRSVITISVAVVGFGYWHHANIASAALVLIPGLVTFAAIGVLSAAFVLAFKAGDPVLGLFAFVSSMLGGALFPVRLLPHWLQLLAWWLPLTNALAGMRLALGGASTLAVLPQVGALWLMAALLLPAAALAFRSALTYAKREGSLVQY